MDVVAIRKDGGSNATRTPDARKDGYTIHQWCNQFDEEVADCPGHQAAIQDSGCGIESVVGTHVEGRPMRGKSK